MNIDGPLNLNVTKDEVQHKRTLEITFKQEFQTLSLEQRSQELKRYIQSLYQSAQTFKDGNAEKTGLELIMQLSEELLPFIQQDELDLEETIKLEMAMGGSSVASEKSVSLTDLNLN